MGYRDWKHANQVFLFDVSGDVPNLRKREVLRREHFSTLLSAATGLHAFIACFIGGGAAAALASVYACQLGAVLLMHALGRAHYLFSHMVQNGVCQVCNNGAVSAVKKVELV